MKCNVQLRPVSRGEVYEMGFTISLGLFAGQYPQSGNPGGGKRDKEP